MEGCDSVLIQPVWISTTGKEIAGQIEIAFFIPIEIDSFRKLLSERVED